MKAAFLKTGGRFEISECPVPEPGPGEVVVRVAYCGICGSDLHLVDAGMLPPGCIIGHELSGRIEAVGGGVEGWGEGDPVVVMPIDPCFSCVPCKKGNTQLCGEGLKRSYGLGRLPGGFAEYMLVKPSMLFRIPDGLDMKTAALNEPWAVAMHGVNMLDPNGESLVLVMGAGPIGLLSVYALRKAGVKDIYVSEPDGFRAEKAAATGAAEVIDPGKTNPATVLHKNAGRAPDVILDCAGTKSSTQDAAAMVGARGKVLVLGVNMGSISIMPLICFAKEIEFKFSFGYTSREFGESIELLASGAVAPDVVISDVMPLIDIGEAFKFLNGPGHSKILIDCRG
jgi:2-desacetyl-2-hydroxyethyl bacteriochlorophyllide A dehydrogenase